MSGAGKQAAQQAAKLGGKDKPSVYGIIAITAGTVRRPWSSGSGSRSRWPWMPAAARLRFSLHQALLLCSCLQAAAMAMWWKKKAAQVGLHHSDSAGHGLVACTYEAWAYIVLSRTLPSLKLLRSFNRSGARERRHCCIPHPHALPHDCKQDVELRSPDTREAGMPQQAAGGVEQGEWQRPTCPEQDAGAWCPPDFPPPCRPPSAGRRSPPPPPLCATPGAAQTHSRIKAMLRCNAPHVLRRLWAQERGGLWHDGGRPAVPGSVGLSRQLPLLAWLGAGSSSDTCRGAPVAGAERRAGVQLASAAWPPGRPV